MKKKALRLLSTVLTAALLVTAVPAIPASAALSEVNSPSGVSSFQSSDHFDAELLRAWVVNDGEDLKIDYQSPLMTSIFPCIGSARTRATCISIFCWNRN